MKNSTLSRERRVQWFHEARFGLFIHWGIHALMGRGEWAMFFERIPARDYAKLADRFRPKKVDADAWARLARDAGMKYMVLTARHHDGFCLFDSRVSEFTSVKTSARRDFVSEYVRACRQAGLKVGLYRGDRSRVFCKTLRILAAVSGWNSRGRSTNLPCTEAQDSGAPRGPVRVSIHSTVYGPSGTFNTTALQVAPLSQRM
jgi:hypothetical protein